jgi:hypothetical protein
VARQRRSPWKRRVSNQGAAPGAESSSNKKKKEEADVLEAFVAQLAALGIRSDLAVAASFGAVFLVLNRVLTPRQALGAMAGGIGSAIYFTPIASRALVAAFSWFPGDLVGERAIALLWGLLGTFFLAGLLVLGERWRKDPMKTIREIKK